MKKMMIIPIALVGACAAEVDVGLAGQSLHAMEHSEGTFLSVANGDPLVTCLQEGLAANVTLGYTVTSTASADEALITASIDGGEEQLIGVIEEEVGWTSDGRVKTARGEAGYLLANGVSEIVVCATQSGAERKRGCSNASTVSIDCPPPPPKAKCNQGGGNGGEGCNPGNSSGNANSNDEGDGQKPKGKR